MRATNVISLRAARAMPSNNAAFYAIDRIEGAMAVVVADDGTSADVQRTLLPARAREGTVLRVSLGSDGRPDWSSAKLDETERQRRLKAAEEQLKKMSQGDPGGDIQL